MDNSNMAVEMIPEYWRPTCDYDSHKPLLYLCLNYTVDGMVMEMGCGDGSTPFLEGYCGWMERTFISLETNKEWADKYPYTTLVSQYIGAFNKDIAKISVLFIDCAPGEIRKDLIAELANHADIIVVHDTEPGAEYVYHMAEVLASFKYRIDLHIDGAPSTTAVSNKWDVRDMVGKWDEFTIV